jgi:dicarboxylate transporter 10
LVSLPNSRRDPCSWWWNEEILLFVNNIWCNTNSFDAFLLRTVAYTTARVGAFTYFYDKVNNDPRRLARPDWLATAGIPAGLIAGIVTNPFDIVFNRMQVDELYPETARRNYAHFLDGLFKVMEEGALMRGALANGLKLAAICSSMTSLFDWCKENSYYFFGPHWINRLWATAVAVTAGTVVSMPFDMIRTRLHTMRPLPNGKMPYDHTFDCFFKIFRYECNAKYGSNA